MKKIIIIVLIVVSVSALVAIGILAYRNVSASKRMAEASEMYRAGKLSDARKLLLTEIKRDVANEEALNMLANIDEMSGDFVGAAFFLRKLATLNPLKNEYRRRLLEMYLACGFYPDILELYKESNEGQIGERLEYAAALASLNLGESAKYIEILKILRAKNSLYAKILETGESISKHRLGEAEKTLAEYIKSSDTTLAAHAICDSAVIAYSRGDNAEAKKSLSSLDESKAYEIAFVKYSTLADISRAEGDLNSAVDYLLKAVKYRPDSVDTVIACANMAMILKRGEVIAELRNRKIPKTRGIVALDYYLKALELSLDGKYGDALKALSLSGELANRPSSILLKFELATSSACVDEVVSAVSELPNMSKSATDAILSRLKNLLKQTRENPSDTQKILKLIYKYDSSYEPAARVVLADSLERKDFKTADLICDNLIKKYPSDRQIFESMLVSLYGQRRYSEGLKLAEKGKHDDFFAQMYAAYFAAKLMEADKSLSHALNMASSPKLSDSSALELGAYYAGASRLEDAVRFADALPKEFRHVSESIKAMAFYRAGNNESARSYFDSAIKATKDDEKSRDIKSLSDFVLSGKADSLNPKKDEILKE